MGELKEGTLAMVYGLTVDVEQNGKCVTLVKLIPPNNDSYFCPLTNTWEEFPPDHRYWWLCDDCDDLNYCQPKNLLPIGDKELDLVKDKEKETEN